MGRHLIMTVAGLNYSQTCEQRPAKGKPKGGLYSEGDLFVWIIEGFLYIGLYSQGDLYPKMTFSKSLTVYRLVADHRRDWSQWKVAPRKWPSPRKKVSSFVGRWTGRVYIVNDDVNKREKSPNSMYRNTLHKEITTSRVSSTILWTAQVCGFDRAKLIESSKVPIVCFWIYIDRLASDFFFM